MKTNVKTFRIVLSGRVQGVGFRYFAESRAKKCNIKGYVKNTWDDKVEVVCQGKEDDLKEFINVVRKGPPFAMVTDVNIEELKDKPVYEYFDIKF